MSVDKVSISMAAQLGTQVREAARKSGKSLSAWLSEAAAERLRAEALAQYLDEWEAEHGAFTPEEMAKAEEELGLSRLSKVS